VTKELGDGRFIVTAQTQQTYCSTTSLDSAVLVAFDGNALHASGPLHAGSTMLLDPNLTVVAQHATDFGHTVATRPHLMARFDGGAFHEVSGVPGVTGKKGGTIDVDAPFDDVALLVDAPASGDRLELFFRVERWNVSGSFEDGNFSGTLVSRAPDGFVSNSGGNYRLPLTR
jgi:hypothetical protein